MATTPIISGEDAKQLLAAMRREEENPNLRRLAFLHECDGTYDRLTSTGVSMKSVMVTCSRCGKDISGLEEPGVATSGFYRVGGAIAGSCFSWNRYARAGETVICDECMHADPLYRADYP